MMCVLTQNSLLPPLDIDGVMIIMLVNILSQHQNLGISKRDLISPGPHQMEKSCNAGDMPHAGSPVNEEVVVSCQALI